MDFRLRGNDRHYRRPREGGDPIRKDDPPELPFSVLAVSRLDWVPAFAGTTIQCFKKK